MDDHAPFDLSRHRVCVLLNAGSGDTDHQVVADRIEAALKPVAAGFSLRRLAPRGDIAQAARQALEQGFDVIVVAGGDGTQSAVAGVLAGRDAVMAVLPGGTFNYFARELGVGEDLDQALHTIRHARTGRVDLGRINDLVFLNNVSLGAYPHILKTREGIYRRWGRSRLAAYWSVLVALRRLRRPMTLTAHVEGEDRHYTTALLFVARSAYQLEHFGLDGAEDVRQGKLAVLIARARQPLPLMRSAIRLALGFSAKDSDFDLIVTDRLTIRTGRRQLVAHDGEKTVMDSPFHLSVMRGALKVLLPAGDGSPAGASGTADP